MSEHEWKNNLSYGVMWLLILLGLGSCNYLCNKPSDTPVISIERSK